MTRDLIITGSIEHRVRDALRRVWVAGITYFTSRNHPDFSKKRKKFDSGGIVRAVPHNLLRRNPVGVRPAAWII